MKNYLFGNPEQFLYGIVCSNEPENISNFKRYRTQSDVIIDSQVIAAEATATESISIINREPIQTANISEVLERELPWDDVLPKIRKIWGVTQSEMAKILNMSEKTVLNIEKRDSRPNTISRKKLFLLRELTSFLEKEIGRKYAIQNLLNSKLPAMGMKSPKDYLMDEDGDDVFAEVLGIFKRMYK